MGKKLMRFDWAIKTVLRDKANFDVLEGFLCALLEDEDVKILSILESESNQRDERDKFNRVDLLVQDRDGRKIYIEIQNARETDYLESLLFCTSKIIVDHQKLGEDFRGVSKVISISILYFNLGLGDDYIYHGTNEFFGANTGGKLVVKKKVRPEEGPRPKCGFEERNIFPEYYLITVGRYKNVVRRKVDEWIYIFKNSEVAEGSSSKNIDRAEQKLAELNMEEGERRAYEKYLINSVRDRDAMDTAKEEGREEGKAEGKAEGKIEGEIEGKTKIAIAMINSGESDEKIKKYTGLDDEKIEDLREQHPPHL